MMSRKYLIPIALILILVLAACGPQQRAETSAAAGNSAETMTEESGDTMTSNTGDSMDAMSDEVMGNSQDDMDAMSDDTMADNHDDMDAMGDEAMDDSQDDMTEMGDGTLDDNHDDMAAMGADVEDMAGTMEEADNSPGMAGEDETMTDASAAMMELPVWQTLPVTDVATGESFTLGDFQGKTVFVEPMATWCSNCRTQQGNVVQARLQLGDDDVVFVGLSLETTLPDEDLARYARDNGFHWTYAVMSEELLAGLADEFGRSITSAPSTPHFIIRPDGSFTGLSTGIDSPGEIVAKIQEAQS